MLSPEAIRQKFNWGIVNSEGKLIERFRLNNTAEKWKRKIEKDYFKELKIVKV